MKLDSPGKYVIFVMALVVLLSLTVKFTGLVVMVGVLYLLIYGSIRELKNKKLINDLQKRVDELEKRPEEGLWL